MQVYRKTFNCSDTFPVERNEEWQVKEGKKVVEHWRVLHKTSKSFTVEITEYIAP
jgi:hypothetical protein